MLIKIIKLFGALTPLEPRLGKKLIEPLTNLIHSTSAMSLLYECINTVIGNQLNCISFSKSIILFESNLYDKLSNEISDLPFSKLQLC